MSALGSTGKKKVAPIVINNMECFSTRVEPPGAGSPRGVTVTKKGSSYLFLLSRGLGFSGAPWRCGLDEVGNCVPDTHCDHPVAVVPVNGSVSRGG
jgi:hypothetical protein